MMGAGPGRRVGAKAGYDVVLKDIEAKAARGGAMAHCEAQIAKVKHLRPTSGRKIVGADPAHAGRSTTSTGCDLIIEAVFENLELKHVVTKETEPMLAKGGIWASNTCAIPIADLAEVSARPRTVHRHALLLAGREDAAARDHHHRRRPRDETLARCAGVHPRDQEAADRRR